MLDARHVRDSVDMDMGRHGRGVVENCFISGLVGTKQVNLGKGSFEGI